MELVSDRLRLCEVSWDDLADIYHLHTYPEVAEFNTVAIPKNDEEIRELIRPLIEEQTAATRKFYFWKVLQKDAANFIGIAGLTLSADKFRTGEIYYKLLPEHWGKGYATEISRRLISTGFDDFALHRIEAGVATRNAASIKVLEKSGMVREGLMRKILPIRGKWIDNYHYAIVEDDPRDY